MAEIIVALDFPAADRALDLVNDLGEAGTFYKVGLELYTRAGPSVVEELRDRGKSVFLDLKLHDIPNTVASAMQAINTLEPAIVTVHASGGRAMMEDAKAAAGEHPRVVAVTMLTSLDQRDLARTEEAGHERGLRVRRHVEAEGLRHHRRVGHRGGADDDAAEGESGHRVHAATLATSARGVGEESPCVPQSATYAACHRSSSA